MTEVSYPTPDKYEACLQSGIPVYSGTKMQRGYGVGGLLSQWFIAIITENMKSCSVHCSRSGHK